MSAVARYLGFGVNTVYRAINKGKLRCHIFGSERRVRPEDFEAFARVRTDEKPPPREDWRTVTYSMRAAGVSRAHAYRLQCSRVGQHR